jgi:EmrB/QacA subfamily drug resistance transporter
MLMPVGMAILYRLAPPDQRGAVMGIFGIPMLLGPALGPVISGWLLEYASWPWIFLINVPVGAVAVIIGLRSLPTLAAENIDSRLDTLGMLLGPLAFASLTYGISQSTEDGWTGRSTVTGITVGVISLAAFIARELTTTQPLLELRVFRNRDFSLAILTQWLMIAGMFGTFFLIPVFLQQVRGFSPFETGLITLPNALVAAMTMPLAGRLFDKIGARPLVFAGQLIVLSAFWMLSGLSAATTVWDLMVPLAVMGGGMGLAMMPLGTHVLNARLEHGAEEPGQSGDVADGLVSERGRVAGHRELHDAAAKPVRGERGRRIADAGGAGEIVRRRLRVRAAGDGGRGGLDAAAPAAELSSRC